jgi:CBS-domain-containing membrane protein
MDMALSVDVTKRDALARLEEADLDWLPAVSGDGRFAGIIERSRLTASLILDVAAQLETAREEAQ